MATMWSWLNHSWRRKRRNKRTEDQQQSDDNTNLDGEENTKKERTLYLPYVRGVSEKIERTCRSINNQEYHIKTAFKLIHTIQHMLAKVKSKVSDDKKKGVVMRNCVGTANMCTWVKPREFSIDVLWNTNKQWRNLSRRMEWQYMQINVTITATGKRPRR